MPELITSETRLDALLAQPYPELVELMRNLEGDVMILGIAGKMGLSLGAIAVIGFYLQPSVGGRRLPYDFWSEFAEIPNILGVKVAAFNRYQTLDVVRAVCDAGREKEITLYTGNDDNIVIDLLTTEPTFLTLLTPI